MKYLFIYLLIINLLTFIVFAADKRKAVKKQWRTKESVLLALSLFGGALGGLLAMYIFRHKTQKAIFKFGMPIILVFQVLIVIFYKLKGLF